MTANNLVAKLYPEIISGKATITMLSNSPYHYYKPASMYIAFNMYHENELKRKQRTLLRPEIEFIVTEVEHFEFAKNRVSCQDGKNYSYDYLVISTGCVPG